jgi:hypothetical protein
LPKNGGTKAKNEAKTPSTSWPTRGRIGQTRPGAAAKGRVGTEAISGQIAEIRAAEAGRTTPWTEAKLRKIGN